MREVRAVVIGLVVVILIAMAIGRWRRPGREFHRVRGYRVEIRKTEHGSTRHVSFTVPMSLVARIATLAPVSDIGGSRSDWNDSDIKAHDILEAARQSSPGQPGIITRDHSKLEVTSDGPTLEIVAKDDWDKVVRIRVPRALVEAFNDEARISPRDVLRKLDDMGPGDVVSIHDRDAEVTITAQAR
ncbi:MAG TPA: hypothetical protein VE007_05610 [Thermoanaerobaculia bacterium]|nr:hypothetical protein [Thermoanaerobaculia bacterium]